MSVLQLLTELVFYYLLFFVCYCLLFSIAGNLKRKKITGSAQTFGKFAVLIPAYKEDTVLVSTISKCLSHNYPEDKFDVIVLEENHQDLTLKNLQKMRVISLKTVGTKGQAIEMALDSLDHNYDFALILDADNVMGKDCLLRMNEILQGGALVVQGHRKSKNKNNSIEVLDSISEEINNHIFRKGQRTLGLSSALIGSGMAFKYSYLKKIMKGMYGIWEDREMELRILRDRVTIEYLEEAIIYDEKVSSRNIFVNQRIKWVYGQIKYIRRTLSFCKGIHKLNRNILNKVIQSVCPPRSLLLGSVFIFSVIALVFSDTISISSEYWLLLLLIYSVSLLFAIPEEYANRDLFKAIIKLPAIIFMMFLVVPLSVIKKKQVYHTPHSYK